MKILIPMISLALVSGPATAQDLTSAQAEQLRAIATAKIAAIGAPGMSLAIGLPGGQVWSEGFGIADLESGTPATADTAYRSASIGKSMTAVATMRLAEQGRLDLDIPIQTYCPRYPQKPWPITTRELLNHTAGVRHYLPETEEAETYLTTHYTDSVAPLEIFGNDPLVLQPGTEQSYSTWGYVVVGCVIEGVTEGRYLDFMRHEIFDRVGMTATRDDDPQAVIPNRAGGYVLQDGVIHNARYADMSGKMAAGGFITTARDLVRFGQAFSADGFLVSEATRKAMLADTVFPNGDGTNYGLGWLTIRHRGLLMATHGGATPGVTGILAVVPECRIAIAGLFNLEGVQDREKMIIQMLDVLLGDGEGPAACPAP